MFGELVFIIYLCQQIFIDFVFFCFNLDEIHSEVGTSCPDLFSYSAIPSLLAIAVSEECVLHSWLSASSSVAAVAVSSTEASAKASSEATAISIAE